jgi:hypothetical protein
MAAALRCKSDEGGGASVLSTDLRALRRGEEGGVGELRCRAWPHNERERRRASTAFDRKEKGKGGPARAAPRGGRMEEGGSDRPTGHAASGDGRRSTRRGSARAGVKGGSGRGGHGWAGPSALCQFRSKQRFLNQNNFNRSKAGFFLIKNSQINYGFASN